MPQQSGTKSTTWAHVPDPWQSVQSTPPVSRPGVMEVGATPVDLALGVRYDDSTGQQPEGGEVRVRGGSETDHRDAKRIKMSDELHSPTQQRSNSSEPIPGGEVGQTRRWNAATDDQNQSQTGHLGTALHRVMEPASGSQYEDAVSSVRLGHALSSSPSDISRDFDERFNSDASHIEQARPGRSQLGFDKSSVEERSPVVGGVLKVTCGFREQPKTPPAPTSISDTYNLLARSVYGPLSLPYPLPATEDLDLATAPVGSQGLATLEKIPPVSYLAEYAPDPAILEPPDPASIGHSTQAMSGASHPARILDASVPPDFIAPFPLEAWEPMLNDTLPAPYGEPFGVTPRFEYYAPPVALPGSIYPSSTSRTEDVSENMAVKHSAVAEIALGAMKKSRYPWDQEVDQALVDRLIRAYSDADIDLLWLSRSLELYWSHVAPTFPFIHRATFQLEVATSELILMMAIVGSVHLVATGYSASHTSPNSHHISPAESRDRANFRPVSQRIRGVLVQDCGLDMPIQTLQAFCLCHVYDTWYSTKETLFVAQCMWPVMVAHSRKKGIGVAGKSEAGQGDGQDAWTAWVKDEVSPVPNISLPCSAPRWEATSAIEWLGLQDSSLSSVSTLHQNADLSTHKYHSGYLPGLQPEFQVNTVSEDYSSAILAALAAEKTLPFRVDLENTLTVQMILMGLMAIAWDCRTRSGMGIRFKEGTKHWRGIVLNALIHLRAAWETSIKHISPSCIETQDMRDTFAISIVSVLGDM